MNFIDKDLISIQGARILSENAAEVQRVILLYKQPVFDKAFEAGYRAIFENLYLFSKMVVEESDYGNIEDTYEVSKLLMEKLYRKLQGKRFVGEFEDGKKIGVPMGGIVLIPSPKNALLSMINCILLALKTGNVLLIATEERVKNLTVKLTDIVNSALRAADCRTGLVSCLSECGKEGIREALKENGIAVVINAGNKEFLPDCIEAGKVFYYGSTGASPVFVDRSADVEKAVKEIVKSRSFNNGIIPGAEQFLVVDAPVIEKVKSELLKNSCYFMNLEDEKRLIRVLLRKGSMDEENIGKSAEEIAKEAGFSVPAGTKLLVSYQEYISEVNSYTQELGVPVLVVYKEPDWLNACEKCIRILTTEHDGHSLSIYSNDQEVIGQFAHKKPVGRVMVNTNTGFSAMGLDSTAYPSAILGSFTRGLGSLSSNLKPEDLVYLRDIVYTKEENSGSNNSDETILTEFLNLLSGITKK